MVDYIKKAFRDFFHMAWHGMARASHPSQSATFKRYFKDGDADFVHEVFKDMFEESMLGPSPAFSEMTIRYGANPDWGDDDLRKTMKGCLAYLVQNLHDSDSEDELIVCGQAMLLPLFNQVECSSLHDHIGYTFESLAGVLIHEYVHWAWLVGDALEIKDPEPEMVVDFKGPGPPDNFRRNATEA